MLNFFALEELAAHTIMTYTDLGYDLNDLDFDGHEYGAHYPSDHHLSPGQILHPSGFDQHGPDYQHMSSTSSSEYDQFASERSYTHAIVVQKSPHQPIVHDHFHPQPDGYIPTHYDHPWEYDPRYHHPHDLFPGDSEDPTVYESQHQDQPELIGHQLADGTMLHGDPVGEAQHWHYQHGDNSCAVVAQMSVYESMTGKVIPEETWARFAEQHHLYDPDSGTHYSHLGRLLETQGVHVDNHTGGTLSEIAAHLEHGNKVMVGLNANEIWYPKVDPTTGLPAAQPTLGHIVWVTGIVESPDGSVKMVINDSGISDGTASVVDYKDFLNAWHDANNRTIIAYA